MAIYAFACVPAVAQEPVRPVCPDPPLAYSGEDDVVREVRLLREEMRAACLAARADADRAHEDAAAAGTDSDRAHDDAVAIAAAIAELDEASASAPDLPSTDEIVAATKPYADAGIAGLGVIAGLVLVVLLLPAIRKYWP